jgi:hypothetical protein
MIFTPALGMGIAAFFSKMCNSYSFAHKEHDRIIV